MSSSSQKGEDEKTMRKITILVSDPDATDVSSDEEQEKRPDGKSKRLCHEIFIDKVEAAAALEQNVVHKDIDSQLDSFSGAIHFFGTQDANVSTGGSPIKKYAGVRRRRSGKYIAEIRDPTMRKKVHLGTFNTAEEAHKAFITRKVAIEKKLASRKGFQCVVSKESEALLDIDGLNSCRGGSETSYIDEGKIGDEDVVMQNNGGSTTEQVDSQLDFFSGAIHSSRTQHTNVSMGGSPIKKYVGAHRRKSGKYAAEIKDPIKKKKVWLGTFNTAKEAHEAYIAKKVEIKKQLASSKGFKCVVSKKSEPVLDIDGLNLCRGGSETSYSDEGKIGEEDVLIQNNGGSDTVEVLANASVQKDTDSQLDIFSVSKHPSETQHATVGMGGSPIKKYVGVSRRRSGKYAAAITNPFKKRTVWLGTFNTAEEAHNAYITRKVEIEKELASRKGFQWVVSKQSEPLPDVGGSNPCHGGCETSYFNEGKMTGEDVLMQNNGGSNTEQGLTMASVYETSTMCRVWTKVESGAGEVTNIAKDGIENNARSVGDGSSIEDCVGSNRGSMMEEISPIVNGPEGTYGMKFSGTHKSPSSVLEFESSNWSNGGSETSKFNTETLQNMGDSLKGLFLQDLNGALPIIDNHGFLLGKWSWIDDLSICGLEETSPV